MVCNLLVVSSNLTCPANFLYMNYKIYDYWKVIHTSKGLIVNITDANTECWKIENMHHLYNDRVAASYVVISDIIYIKI